MAEQDFRTPAHVVRNTWNGVKIDNGPQFIIKGFIHDMKHVYNFSRSENKIVGTAIFFEIGIYISVSRKFLRKHCDTFFGIFYNSQRSWLFSI